MERTVAERDGPGPMAHERDPAVAFQDFLDLWERLVAEGHRAGTVLVVEGERDRTAVRRLGWPGPVAIVHDGRRLSATAQSLIESSRRVIVLTDWDSKGGTLARRLKEFLTADRTELDLEFRRRLARVLRGELVHVEGLYGWARRAAERLRLPFDPAGDDEPAAGALPPTE